jgi:hypothetical protein
MPSPGATPVPGQDAMDLGGGLAATVYSDGGVVVWRIAPPNEEVASIEAGRQDPADLGDGRAAVVKPGGGIDVFPISNPPPQYSGAPERPTPPTVAQPKAGGVNNPINMNPGGYGSRGFLPSGEPRPSDLLQGTTDFGRGPNVNIRPEYADPLQNTALAPGYLQGSGSYNQFPLNQEGLFGTLPGTTGTVNMRFGLGGPGDPTNGSELQTPELFVQGHGSATAQQGDPAWRRAHGTGGGWEQTWQDAVPGYRPGPAVLGVSAPTGGMQTAGYGASNRAVPQGMGGGGTGGMGGGMFGTTIGANYGSTPETAGKGYLATLFLRSDTPTGVGTPAYAAPQQYWDSLAQEIAAGRITVQDPLAWQMLAQHGYASPAAVGGAATGGANVQPGGAATGGPNASGDALGGAAANAAASAAADRAAYWAYQQALLRQGDRNIAIAEARAAWDKTYQEAGLTGQYNGTDTLAGQAQRAQLTGMFEGHETTAYQQQLFNQEMQKVANELAAAGLLGTYQGQQTLAAKAQEFQQAISAAGLTGVYNGAPTQQAIAQQNSTALSLMQLQSQLQGPRNWAAYQKTFGATPQGLKDVMGAFQGRYELPTGQGAQNTAQGGSQSVAGLGGDILSGTYGQDGQSGAATMNPRQADVRNWARMMPSQREMILGNYEQNGWYAPDVEKLIQGAAPKYSGPQTGSYNFFQS